MTIFELTIFGFTIAPSYYGLMYAIGFMSGYWIIKGRGQIIIPPPSGTPFEKGRINSNIGLLDDLFLYIFLGVVLGGRLGYVFFYNFSSYILEPLNILKVWEGGMSFHGGVIGVIIAMILFAKIKKIDFYKLADQVTLVLPIGLGLGRIGNYLNGELLGYSGYNGILAIYHNNIGYFPSTLVEMFLEGIVLFVILNYFYYKKNLSSGQIASLFLIFYGLFRIIVEIFFRMPDIQIGYIYGYFTMGELLSLPMFVIGLILFYKLKK